MDAITARGLVKRFGATTALAGIDLDVPEGSVLGLLGPNGAGKTTAVRILTTLLKPDEGSAQVLGLDVLTDGDAVRRRVGLAGQYATLDELLTGRQNLVLLGRLMGLGRKAARARSDELLARFDLTDAGDRAVSTFSGGMRRRIDLAASIIASPPVIVLDEPTTGLDPRSRAGVWDLVRELVDEGTTVLLTTQYLEEADRLADRIVMIDRGVVAAEGTPAELKAKVGLSRLEVTPLSGADPQLVVTALSPAGTATVDGGRIVLALQEGYAPLATAVRLLDAAGLEVADVTVHTPSLDDVFLSVTGEPAHSTDEEVAA